MKVQCQLSRVAQIPKVNLGATSSSEFGAWHKLRDTRLDDEDDAPTKKRFKEKTKTPSTSSSEEPKRKGKSASTSLDLDENMNFDQCVHEKNLKDQKAKATSPAFAVFFYKLNWKGQLCISFRW